MHTTINHPRRTILCPCSIDGIGGIGISTTTIRRRVYDRRHITAIDGGGGEMYHPTSSQSLNNNKN